MQWARVRWRMGVLKSHAQRGGSPSSVTALIFCKAPRAKAVIFLAFTPFFCILTVPPPILKSPNQPLPWRTKILFSSKITPQKLPSSTVYVYLYVGFRPTCRLPNFR